FGAVLCLSVGQPPAGALTGGGALLVAGLLVGERLPVGLRLRGAHAASPIPVLSTSSPPRSRWAMSGTSAMWTQRTGRASAAAPATTRGEPCRTASSASTSRTVGNTAQVLRHSSQKATAAAAATLSESTPACIGITTAWSLALLAASVSPGPSAPR